MQENVKLIHICEVCGKTALLTPQEAYDIGWDYPPMMGHFGIISPRTCPNCRIEDTVWAALALHKKSVKELTADQMDTIYRILGEPEDLLVKDVDVSMYENGEV